MKAIPLSTVPWQKWMSCIRIRQASWLYLSVMVGMGIGFITSILNTRTLGPEAYGNLKFILTLFQFLATISSLGLYTTGAQVLASCTGTEETRREYIGALLVIGIVLAGVFLMVGLILALLEPMIFGHGLSAMIIFSSPLVCLLVLQPFIENILQGENRIQELSAYALLPGLLYMCFISMLSIGGHVNLSNTIASMIVAVALSALVFVQRLRPRFHHLRRHVKAIWAENRRYGLQVYFGLLSNVATSYVTTFMISYYIDNKSVGFFSLAVTLAAPLSQVASVVGTTYFKDFAHADVMPAGVTRVTHALAFGSLLVFLVLIHPLVLMVYTTQFSEVVRLSSIVAVGASLHGLGDYYNRFLGAHAQGRQLRNGAIVHGIVTVAGSLLVIKFLGVEGAALTRACGSATYAGMMFLYYRRYCRPARS